MRRFLVAAYGFACYLVFFIAFLYLVGFLTNAGVPKGIDDGQPGPPVLSVATNLLLIALFGLQHSVMARPWFKRGWTRIVAGSVERSTYVLASSLVLCLIFWLWQPLPHTIWLAEHAWLRIMAWVLFIAGFLIVLLSTFMTDHFDLFGLRQVWLRFVERPYSHPTFKVVYFYRFVRHPLYSGLFLALWSTPHMTAGHLLFAAGLTVYVLVAVRLEERDLAALLGSAYAGYRQRVPMFMPRPGRVHESIPAGKSSPSRMR